jgi:biotin carboxyl carrier protein
VTLDLDVAGQRYRASISIARDAASRLRVMLLPLDPPGRAIEYLVDVSETEHGYTLMRVPDGRVIDAAVATEGVRNQLLVQLPGVDVDVVVNGRRHGAIDSGAAGGGEQRICAPMPGRVLRVLAQPGAAIVAGQVVVVIEAMKMENALTALRDGIVQEVAVTEGISVEAGRLLLRLG